MTSKIKLNIDSWNIRIDQRSRNRMKIVIKMGKEEAEAYKSFESTVRPDEVSSEVFAKSIFFNGIEAMNKELSRMVEEYIKENPDASSVGGDFSAPVSGAGNVEIISDNS
jgi:hypothetical protein